MVDYNKPLISATLQDFKEIVEDIFIDTANANSGINTKKEPAKPKEYQFGIPGIAKIFGCSFATAQRIKSEGTIDGAISQIGNIIVVDVQKALELTNLEDQKRKAIGKRSRFTQFKK